MISMIYSPNTVLAKYLKDVIDVVRPRLELSSPKEVLFYVGTNINGVPHIGTYLVQSFAFIIAKKIQDKFRLPVRIIIGIHDNISHDSKENNGHAYHRTFQHALGSGEVNRLIKEYYSPYLEKLRIFTGVSYRVEIYSDAQNTREFRGHFLRTLDYADNIRWCTAPSSGLLQVRVPCPDCLFSERDAIHTKLIGRNKNSAVFRCLCWEHGSYDATIDLDNNTYIDLNTLYRNIVKEFIMSGSKDSMSVVIKGGDWVYSTQTIDWALGILGYKSNQTPVRIFLPQIVTAEGAKLSKSVISEGHESVKDVPGWIVDMCKFREENPDYSEKLIRLTELMLADPRNVFRSYSYKEIERLLGNI
jgi:hypothetical protein